MFGWFKTTSPLTDAQRSWIDARFAWLLAEFGDTRLRRAIVTPTNEFFPDAYAGTVEDAGALFKRICHYMDIDPTRIDLSFYKSAAADDVAVSVNPVLRGFALGTYSESGGRIQIRLERTRLREPQSAVATIAHELGHVHLLSDGRCSAESADHEPLTDLLTVFFGMGIFSANSAIREANWRVGRFSGWNVARHGYLSMAEYAYALAIYSTARGEQMPEWMKYLRPDVRALYKFEVNRMSERGFAKMGAGIDARLSDQEDAGPVDSRCSEDFQEGDSRPADANRLDEESASETAGYDNDEAENHDDIGNQNADELFSAGVLHASAGRFEVAVEAFSESLRLKSGDPEVRLNRARSYIALGKFAEAIDDCTIALRREPDDAEIYCCRAHAYLWLRKWAASLDDLRRACRLEPRDPMLHLLSGLAQAGLGEYRLAVSEYNKAIRFAPTWGDNYLARSQAYAAIEEEAQAQADLLEAVRRDPRLADEGQRTARLAGRPLSG